MVPAGVLLALAGTGWYTQIGAHTPYWALLAALFLAGAGLGATITPARQDEAAYHARLAELERLATARVADLARPGQVLLRLAARGFGITLSSGPRPAPPPRHPDHPGGP